MLKAVSLTNGEFIESNKRKVQKGLKGSPKYFRSSIAARIAFSLLDRAIELNRKMSFSCAKGCSYCCHIQTDVTAGEAFVLADAVRSMPDDQRDDVVSRLRDNAGKVATMGLSERHVSLIPCAFLDLTERSCTVHASRPTACRRWHSLDASACRDQYDRIVTDRVISAGDGVPIDPYAAQIASLVIAGYWQAMNEPQGELHQAVLMALEPDSERRFARGEDIFKGLKTTSSTATEEEIERMKLQARRIREATSDGPHDIAS